MAIEIRVPTLGESITEATVGKWFKKPGEAVKQDEPLVELETDKVTLEVNAPRAGVLSEITAQTGATVGIGALLGQVTAGAAGAAAPAPEAPAAAPKATPAAPAPATSMPPSPAAAKVAADNRIDAGALAGSGKRGQVLKGDVLAAVALAPPQAAPAPSPNVVPLAPAAPQPISVPQPRVSTPDDSEREERVRMTKLARRSRGASRMRRTRPRCSRPSTRST